MDRNQAAGESVESADTPGAEPAQDHGRPENGRANTAKATSSEATRMLVRFPALRGRARPALKFMYVDEALNALGMKLHPLAWGIGPAWAAHPFQYSGRHKRYVTYSIKRTG